MTHISKPHQRFSNHLNEPRVLTEPQEFLGPNYEAVLDFWLFLDHLTETQWETIDGRYWGFCINQQSEWSNATHEALIASSETIGWKFAIEAPIASVDVYAEVTGSAAVWATRELIGKQILLDQQKPLSFFNMFLNL